MSTGEAPSTAAVAEAEPPPPEPEPDPVEQKRVRQAAIADAVQDDAASRAARCSLVSLARSHLFDTLFMVLSPKKVRHTASVVGATRGQTVARGVFPSGLHPVQTHR